MQPAILSAPWSIKHTVGKQLARSLLLHCKTCKPLWLTSTRAPSLLGRLLVTTLVVHKSWKARMDLGRDPREGTISLFGIDCYQGCWLCVYKRFYYISFAASKGAGVIRSCFLPLVTSISHSPRSFMDLTLYSHATSHLISPEIHQAYSGKMIGAKPTFPLQDVLASLVHLNSRS